MPWSPLILGQDDIIDETLGMLHLSVVSIIDTMQFHGDIHKQARQQRCQRQCCADAKMQPVHDVPPNDLSTVGARRSRQQRAHRRSHLPTAVIPSVVIVPEIVARVPSRRPGMAQQLVPEDDFLCYVTASQISPRQCTALIYHVDLDSHVDRLFQDVLTNSSAIQLYSFD